MTLQEVPQELVAVQLLGATLSDASLEVRDLDCTIEVGISV
eukprot:CAMPEP_0181492622 /NCGR_PEP_ID=MMETSP1110-20121109/50786_1 /TAXON_ID=174948 /ORGANISM="Symbiodinium sp., Strain CCMP421" /LENGTH=40 /DNA_ID= /DNA_START= /DNA_END= /DNA_ORIENTATION=